MQITSNSPADTLALGEILGRLARPGDIYCLLGELGAGKTALAQGIGRGLGIEDPVSSPTFTLIHEYKGRMPLYHMDLYRMAAPEEGEELGLQEYFWGHGLCVVEWPQAAAELLPADILQVELRFAGDSREIELAAHGSRSQQIVEEVTRLVDSEH